MIILLLCDYYNKLDGCKIEFGVHWSKYADYLAFTHTHTREIKLGDQNPGGGNNRERVWVSLL